MSSEPFDGYVVIIDTDKYAGNFEREMCAFITGQIGECGVGDVEQSTALNELDSESIEWFQDNVAQMGDEHGCARPATIHATPGRPAYNSVGIYLYSRLPVNITNVIKKRATEFAKGKDIEIEGFRLKHFTSHTEDIP